MESSEEKSAIDQLIKGNLDGLDWLAREYYDRAERTAWLNLQDSQAPDDGVQEAFIQAGHKIHQLRGSSFAPWFLKSVVNRALSLTRKRARFVPLDSHDTFEGEAPASSMDQISPSIEENLISAENSLQIAQIINRLTPRQRAILVRKYYLGFSEKELVEEYGRPLSTIKYWLFAARQKLKLLLENHDVSENGRVERQ